MATLAILERYQSLVHDLLAAISIEVGGGIPDKDPAELIQLVIAEDKLLREEAAKLKKQQELQRESERLKASIDASDATLLQMERELRRVETTLVESLGEAKAKLANIRKAEAANVTVEELLSLSHRFSAAHSTTAPRDWQPGSSARRPFPSIHEMKSGALAALASQGNNVES
eukprot:m.102406 g.102406  ORF g.102406 m.102406 type:complete len:173 (-) comp10437_c0_seq1:209-727(-)